MTQCPEFNSWQVILQNSCLTLHMSNNLPMPQLPIYENGNEKTSLVCLVYLDCKFLGAVSSFYDIYVHATAPSTAGLGLGL